MQTFALDLEQSYYDKVARGNIRVIGTWVKLHGEPNQACLVLFDNTKKIGAHSPFVILMDNLWAWIEEANDDSYDIAERSANAVVTMGRELTNAEMFFVCDAVRDAADDLLGSDVWSPVLEPVVIGESVTTNLLTGEKTESDVKTFH